MKTFAEKCRLAVNTGSREKLMEAILHQTDYDPKKKKKRKNHLNINQI